MDMNNMGDLLKNAHKIRRQIDSVQAELKERVVEGSAAGGSVEALVNGHQELLKLTIRPEAISDAVEDVELLEDMIIAAVNQALEKSRELRSREIDEVTGGMGETLGGLFG